MILQHLNLNRIEYGVDKGKLSGHVKFLGEHGSIEVRVSHEQATRFLEIFADALVETSKELANNLTNELVEAPKTISQSLSGRKAPWEPMS